nr:zinc finger MYM-type protein 1-like [Tanacetum cinerariifolium]
MEETKAEISAKKLEVLEVKRLGGDAEELLFEEIGLDNAISEAKLIAETIDIQPEFTVKRVPCRNKQFDEISNTEREQQSAKEQIKIDYFLVVVDMALVQLNSS